MPKKIYLQPLGGLANRMRVIASALALKEKYNIKFETQWRLDSELHSEFEALFEPILELNLSNNNPRFPNPISSFRIGLYQKLTALLKNIYYYRISLAIRLKDVYQNHVNETEIFTQKIKYHPSIFIESCHDFLSEKSTPYFKNFIPIAPIQKKIDEITSHFHPYTIGVHIRRTDNSISIEKSPNELFFSALENELKNNPRLKIFLATDDETVEQQFMEKYPTQLITFAKTRNRTSTKGIQDAVVDMYCLGKTQKIYGSYWSSFSEISSKLFGTELQILSK